MSQTQVPCEQQFSSSANTSFLVLGCAFSSLYSGGTGGAISIQGSLANLSVREAIFASCSANSSGGGLYFSGYYGTVDHVCGSNCYTLGDSHGQLLYFSTSPSVTSYHSLISGFQCSNATSSGRWDSLLFTGGIHGVTCLNASNNTVWDHASGCKFASLPSASLSFSNFAGCNNTIYYIVLYMQQALGSTVTHTNFIQNVQTNTDDGTVFAVSTSASIHTVSNCVFFGNSGGAVVSSDSAAILTAINCTISHTGNITTHYASDTNCVFTLTAAITFNSFVFQINNNVCKLIATALKSSPFTRGNAYYESPIFCAMSAFILIAY